MRTISVGGIDPGFQGCLAIIRPNDTVEFRDPPTVKVEMSTKSKAGNVRHRTEYLFADLAAILDDEEAKGLRFVAIEKVIAMPNLKGRPMPPASALGSGIGFGMWQMGLACFGIPYQVVAAASWKAEILRDHAKTKEGAVAFAMRLYPQAAPQLRTPRGALLDGRAEALLLAHWALSRTPA